MGTYATTTSFSVMEPSVDFTGTTTSAIASKCIDWAEQEIDKMLSSRYDVQAFKSDVPPLITALCEQLALGYFYERTSRAGKESEARGDKLVKRVMANLTKLASGDLSIVDDSGDIIAERRGSGVRSTTSTYSSTFAEDNPLHWRVDKDKLQDIKDERS